MNMRTINIKIHKKWFDMILSGEKKEDDHSTHEH